ncbi:MAG: hypothetical protein ACYS0H_18335 [Planctomycetota bacterium]
MLRSLNASTKYRVVRLAVEPFGSGGDFAAKGPVPLMPMMEWQPMAFNGLRIIVCAAGPEL